MTRFRRSCVLLACVASTASGQQGKALKLPAPDKSHGEEFSVIAGVRELKDGRLLVSDSKDNRVVVVDFEKGTTTVIGRVGNGPGEYPKVAELVAMPGDSSMMPMDQGGTWMVFDGAQPPTRWTSDRSIGRQRFAMVAGFDRSGRMLVLSTSESRTGILGKDSLDAFVHTRESHQEQAVGKAVSPFGSPSASGAAAGARAESKMELGGRAGGQRTGAGLFMMDRAVLFPDGWIAIARLHPYRVDWRAPNGTTSAGAAIITDQKYNDNDKLAYLAREAETTGRPARSLELTYNWPEFIPPFNGLQSPVFGPPDGTLWIARTVSAGLVNRYDVVDRKGQLSGVLTLPSGERIAGFGAKTIYTAKTDDNGIQKLRRHPWNWSGPIVKP
jgi:hypothetical protein